MDQAVQGGFDVAISATYGTDGSPHSFPTRRSSDLAGTVGESHDVSVTIKGDTIVEANETFSVQLGAVTGTRAAQHTSIPNTPTHTVSRNNHDSAELSIVAPSITETNIDQTVLFTVT